MNTPQFTIQTAENKGHYAKFVLEPLPQGYGDTLGNALRRVLYSAIPGAAITSVVISGASHQFTAIEGVKEDAVQLVLALKQVKVAYSGDKPVHITLSSKGTNEITAADFELPAGVTIANPELVLAHLSEKTSKLEIDATVEAGLGYSPAEDRKSTTVGVIPVDATFTPVTRVNYTVEATRVGRVTNFDKLILEITTDGTISPADAMHVAAEDLVSYFTAIINPQTASNSASSASTKTVAGSTISVEELDLPTRIANALQKAGFDTVASLLVVPRAELAKVKNLGGKSVKVIEVALKERGFELA